MQYKIRWIIRSSRKECIILKNKIKNSLIMLISVGFCFVLTGCLGSSSDELYKLPKQTERYVQLQKKIDELQAAGTVFSAPVSGYNHQAIQMNDLDGDGTDEVVALLRTDDENPLNVQILKDDSGAFEVVSVIEGAGSDFDSIDYVDMDGDGILELIIGWKMSPSLKLLNIYSIKNFQPVQLCSDSYSHYIAIDADSDNDKEILIFHPPGQDSPGEAVLYMLMHDGEMTNYSSKFSPLSETVTKIHTGLTADKNPAVYVDSTSQNGVITDVFAFSDNALLNIAYDPTSEASPVRDYAVYCSDINGDGIVEIPNPVPLLAQSDTVYYALEWYTYRINGKIAKQLTTYHNYSDGWYIILPDTISANFTIRREDSAAGERTVVLSTVSDGSTIHDFLKIYSLTGDSKEERAAQAERFVILEESETIYCAQLIGKNTLISQDELKESFKIIRSEWLSGEI